MTTMMTVELQILQHSAWVAICQYSLGTISKWIKLYSIGTDRDLCSFFIYLLIRKR